MNGQKLGKADYPLAEKRADLVRGPRGKALDEITLDSLLAGEVTIEDMRITPAALAMQAEIARDAGRAMLAANLERAGELVSVPQDVLMRLYELLRPGRASGAGELKDAARLLRGTYKAEKIAAFIEEAAAVYEQRGLFKKRF